MAWLSNNSFTSGALITHTMFNNLANDIRNWGGNVNAGGYSLSNIGSLMFPNGDVITNISSFQTPWKSNINGGAFALTNVAQYSGKWSFVDPSTDDLPAVNIGKPSGGHCRLLMSSLANTANYLDVRYGAQIWFVGVGITDAGATYDTRDLTGGYTAIRCFPASTAKRVEIRERLVINTETIAVVGALAVNGSLGLADTAATIKVCARFSCDGHGSMLFDSQNITNASGYRRGFLWPSGTDTFSVCRFGNAGGPVIQDMYFGTDGKVGIGTVSPQNALHIQRPASGVHLAVYGDDGVGTNLGWSGISLGRAPGAQWVNFVGQQMLAGSYAEGIFVIQVRTGDALAEKFRMLSNGFTSFSQYGGAAPYSRVMIYGTGISENAGTTFSPAYNKDITLTLADGSGSAYAGGALQFAAAGLNMAAIRVSLLDAANYGRGDLVFFTRSNAAASHVDEAFRITMLGQLVARLMGTTAPAAGSKQIWADPADGYRLKFAI